MRRTDIGTALDGRTAVRIGDPRPRTVLTHRGVCARRSAAQILADHALDLPAPPGWTLHLSAGA